MDVSFLLHFALFWDRCSLCRPGLPQTHYIFHSGTECVNFMTPSLKLLVMQLCSIKLVNVAHIIVIFSLLLFPLSSATLFFPLTLFLQSCLCFDVEKINQIWWSHSPILLCLFPHCFKFPSQNPLPLNLISFLLGVTSHSFFDLDV